VLYEIAQPMEYPFSVLVHDCVNTKSGARVGQYKGSAALNRNTSVVTDDM